jgi:hypothetical protein
MMEMAAAMMMTEMMEMAAVMEMMMEMDQGHPQMNAHQAMSKAEQQEANK